MTEYGPKRYRLVFYGNVMQEADPSEARAAFARAFRLEGEKLARCFSGERVVLGRDLTEKDAWQLQSRLESFGLITHMEMSDAGPTMPPSGNKRSATDTTGLTLTPAEKPSPEQSAYGDPDNSAALCPACGGAFDSGACPHCTVAASATSRQWVWWLATPVLVAALLVPPIKIWVLPVMEDLQTRVRVDDGVSTGRQVTAALQDFIDRTGFVPNSNLDASLPEPADYANDAVSSVHVRNQALVVVRFRETLPRIGGATITLVPQKNHDGSFSWRCDGGTLPANYVPEDCRPPEAEMFVAEKKFSAPVNPVVRPETRAEQFSPSMVRDILADEIARTREARQRMLGMLTQQGQWPGSNEQVGLPNPRRYGSAAFRRVAVEPEGRMVFVFSSTFPELEGHKLWLVPGEPGAWSCESTLPPEFVPDPCSG